MAQLTEKQRRKVCPRGHKLGRANLTPDGHCKACRRLHYKRGWKGGVANDLKTHCPAGHPYQGDNLNVYQRGKYKIRSCRECKRIKARWYYRSKHPSCISHLSRLGRLNPKS